MANPIWTKCSHVQDIANNIAQLNNFTSLCIHFRLFVDHDDTINMTGRKTSSTDRLGKKYELCNFNSPILPSLKYLETIRILMQTLLIMLNVDHHKLDKICNAAIALYIVVLLPLFLDIRCIVF
jgi:hypothetical protein